MKYIPTTIRFAASKDVRTLIQNPIPQFSFSRKGSWLARSARRFLVHVATRLLRAVGAYVLTERWKSEEMELRYDTIADRLREAKDVLMHNGSTQAWNLPAVLAGPDVIDELKNELRNTIPFEVPVRVKDERFAFISYYGIRVIYVPWLRGGFIPITQELASEIARNNKPPF